MILSFFDLYRCKRHQGQSHCTGKKFGYLIAPRGTLGTLPGTLGTLVGTLGTLAKPLGLHQGPLELPGKSMKNNFGPPKYPWRTLGTLVGTLGTLAGTLGTLKGTLGTFAKPLGLHQRPLELPGKSVINNFWPPKYPWGTLGALGTLMGTLGTLVGTLGTLAGTLGTFAKPPFLYQRPSALPGKSHRKSLQTPFL